jgi:hypothetical protein
MHFAWVNSRQMAVDWLMSLRRSTFARVLEVIE